MDLCPAMVMTLLNIDHGKLFKATLSLVYNLCELFVTGGPGSQGCVLVVVK